MFSDSEILYPEIKKKPGNFAGKILPLFMKGHTMPSLLNTKKTSSNQAGMIRDNKNHPKWGEAVEAMRLLEIELAESEEEVRKAEGAEGLRPATPSQNRIANFAKALLAKVSGKPEPAKIEIDSPTVWERNETAKNALAQKIGEKEKLRFTLAPEIYKAWEDEHLEARKRIVAAVIELKKSWDFELALAQKMLAAGALTSSLPGYRLLCNFSNCGALPSLIQTMNLRGFIETNKNLLT
ncbi:MAG: hypothetical protein ABSA16_12265 [Thermoguttaceae bacterium]